MSSSRRRSRTFDLSSLSADEIQQIHEDADADATNIPKEVEQQKIIVDEKILQNVTKHLVVHLTSYKQASETKLRKDLEEIKQEIVNMLENVLVQKSTNSVVLYGNPGCGKRLVVESAVQQIQNTIGQENEGLGVVRLSGFLHRRDKC
eukprot:TRINITY_DN28125_c0_g1_i2.p1 TRINITY_DN28125_c0_g1~~TRINITY_DN28125_c0_g1_i2.p1  ORF type:complete len:148 (+),score=15.87 TRINITY_DN28125_c0_g1_i2:179-622(+)